MTDQPPPPSDEKPRRRSAPRKRAPQRPAEAIDAKLPTADAVGATAVAESAGSGTNAPKPPGKDVRRTSKVRGGMSKSSLGTGTTDGTAGAVARERPATEVPPHAHAPASALTAAPVRTSPTSDDSEVPVSAERAEVEPTTRGGETDQTSHATPPLTDAADAQPKRVHLKHAAAPQVHEQAASPATPSTFGKQAELRPGELIRVPLSVRWRDLDAFNHVNNSKYLSYLEEARLRWMLAIPGMGMDDDVAPVVAASSLNYRRPIAWPGDVVVELFVERLGGSSLTIGHRIVDLKDGSALYCDGHVVMVWIDRNTGRSAPLPESVRVACR